MDEVLQQTVVYGALTVVLLMPRLPQLLPQRQAKLVAYILLTAVLMYLAYLPIAAPRKNFYAMLEVDVHANRNDILQGYRNVSKKYHPDRVASSGVRPPFAGDMPPEEYFQELKKAQEVLTHDIRKSFYDRFGDLKEGKVGEQDERISITAVCLSLAAHLLCFTVGFILSFPKHVSFARQIFFIYSVAVFCIEIQERFVEDDDSLNFLPFVSGLLPFLGLCFPSFSSQVCALLSGSSLTSLLGTGLY
ncbi:DnaJ domain-containing protein, putative [Eimeria acervulina]|uniref:DnaJ domain-containing protein, putative n=1 Tax=Eimeria acervulina TaxID=5801 RepID=U6GI88_EIMAC|nr:DnaJ domain-containing protein, putative [Eimeria acervulina]CDI79885.1 DnaJ domain-containing protein, putative [Eimeria acervulina]